MSSSFLRTARNLFSGAMALGLVLGISNSAHGASKVEVPTADTKTASARMASLPLSFEANQGQADRSVQFLSRGAGYTLLLSKGEVVLAVEGKDKKTEYIHVRLAGSDVHATVRGEQRLGGKTNYFIGSDRSNWLTGITNFGKVRYSAVYPGVDVVYYGKEQKLEHDFIVAPNSDPRKIALEVSGAKKIDIDRANGDLVLHTATGEMRLMKPQVYQQIAGKRVEVAGGYALGKHKRVGFELGAYDRSKQLVIDPVLNYGTYLSTAASVSASAVAVDSSGKLYVAGTSSSNSFPPTVLASHTLGTSSNNSVYVTKIDPTANDNAQMVYTTFITGSTTDSVSALSVDASGDLYLAGDTVCSSTATSNWPTTGSAPQNTCTALANISYASELDPTGASLLYSTYFGGATSSSMHTAGMSVSNGSIYMVGNTAAADLPTTANAFSTTPSGGGVDGFLAVIDSNSSSVSNAACDGAGNVSLTLSSNPFTVNENVVVSNLTSGAGNTYNGPATISGVAANVISFTSGGCVAAENAALSGNVNGAVEYATYFGGSGGATLASGVAVGAPNSVYLGGNTTANNLPTSVTAFQAALSGAQNGFVANLDPTQSGAASFVYGTYYGGTGTDAVHAVVLDGAGNVFIGGDTTSTDLPSVTGPQGANGGGQDGFLAQFTFDLSAVNAADYLGGTGTDSIKTLAFDSANNAIWAAGDTSSPTKFNVNGIGTAFSGATNGFVAQYDGALTTLQFASYVGSTTDTVNGIAVSGSNQVAIAGNTQSTSGIATSSAYQTIPASTSAGFAQIISANASSLSAALTLTGNQTNSYIYTDGGANVQTTQYTWTVNNPAAGPATSVTLDLPIPGGASSPSVTFSSVTPTGFVCTSGAGGLTCQTPSIVSGGTATVVVTVGLVSPCAAATCPDISAQGTVSSAEGSSSAAQSITTHRIPVTALTLTPSASSDVSVTDFVQDTDSSIDYKYVVTNAGANDAANVRLTITVDPAFTITSTADSSGAAVCGQVANVLTCTLPVLPAGGTWTFDALGTPDNAYAAGSRVLGNSATVDSAAPSFFDTNVAGNAGLLTPFTQERDTVLANTLTSDSPKPLGGTFTFTDTFGNTGNSNAPTVAITDQVDALLTNLTATSINADPSSGTTTLTDNIAGQTASANIDPLGRLTGAGTFVYTAQAQSDIYLPTPVDTLANSGASRVANVVTITTTAPHNLNPGDSVFVYGVTGGATNFNGTFVITSVPSVTTFTYAQTAVDDTAGTGFVRNSAASFDYTTTSQLTTPSVINNAVLPLSSTNTATVQRQAALSLSAFTANPTGTVPLTTPITFSNNILNGGPNDAINMVVTYTLTTGSSISQDATVSGFSGYDYCTANPNSGTTQTIVCTLNGLTAAAASQGVSLNIIPPVTSNFTSGNSDSLGMALALSSVSTLDQTTGDDAQTAPSITVQRRADLDITSPAFAATTSSGSTTVPLAGNITYQYSIANNGVDPAVHVLSSIALAPGSSITSNAAALNVISSAGTTCAYNAAGPSLDCDTASIASSTTSAITVRINTPQTTTLNTAASDTLGATVALGAQVNTFDTTSGNNSNATSVALTMQRQADLDVSGAFSGTPATNLTGSIAYTFNVANAGPDAAKNATVHLALASVAAPGTIATPITITGQPSGAVCSINGGNLDCLFSTVPLQGATPYTVTLTPPVPTSMTGSSAIPTDTYNSNASLSAPTAYVDLNAANDANATTVATTINRRADLQLNFGGGAFTVAPASPNTVSLAGPLTYTLAVNNAGPDTALNVDARLGLATGAVTTPFAVNSGGVSATNGAVVSCANTSSSQLDCTIVSLPVGSTTLTIPVTPPLTASMNGGAKSDSLTTSATTLSPSVVDDGTSGAPGANNTFSSTLPTTIERQADIALTGLTAVSDVTGTSTYIENVDSKVTYTATIVNNGPDTAMALDLTATVPAGFTVTTAGCNVSGTTLTCANALPSVAPNGVPVTFSFDGHPPTLSPNAAQNIFGVNLNVSSNSTQDLTNSNNSASVNVTDTRNADVSLAIAAHGYNGADNQANKFIESVDTQIHYQVTLTNAGPSIATGTSLNLSIPTGSTLTGSVPAGCSQSGNAVVCSNTAASLANIAVGTRVLDFYVIPVALTASTPQATFNNAVSSTGGYNDSNPADNTNVPVTVSQERDADVQLAIVAHGYHSGADNQLGKFIEGVDTQVHYAVTLTNAGPSVATGTALNMTIPTGSTLVAPIPAGCSQSANAIVCPNTAASLANLAVGSQTVDFFVTPVPLASTNPQVTFNNQVSTTGGYVDSNTANNTNVPVTLSQERDADVSIGTIAAVGNNSGLANTFVDTQDTQLTVTIPVNNAGPSPLPRIDLAVTVPSGTTTTNAGCSVSGTIVTCNDIFSGTPLGVGSSNFVIGLVPPALGTNSSQAFFFSASTSGGYQDSNTANNTNISGPSVTVKRSADLGITAVSSVVHGGVPTPSHIALDSSNAARLSQIDYSFAITNNGPSNAQNVVVTDTLPSTLSFLSSTSGCTASGQTVSCPVAALANGASSSVTFTVVPNMPTNLSNTFVDTTAAISSADSIDSVNTNDSLGTAPSAQTVEIRGDADLGMTITPSVTTVNVGQTLSYTVTLNNAGPWPAAGVQFSFTTPFTMALSNSPAFSCTGSLCTLQSPSLASGSPVTATFTGVVPPSAVPSPSLSQAQTFSASATSYNAASASNSVNFTDANNADNSVTHNTVTARAASNISSTQASNTPVLFNAGPAAHFSGVVTNTTSGLSTAYNVQVVNTLTFAPANMASSITNLSSGCSAGAISGGSVTITCALANIAAPPSANTAAYSFDVVQTLPGKITSSVALGLNGEQGSIANPASIQLTVDNTGVGSNVVVNPSDPITSVANANIAVTFPSVTTQGTTQVTTASSGAIPFGEQLGTSPVVYSVSTNAAYSGALGVCVNYAPSAFIKVDRIRLYAANLDITTSLNNSTSTICGSIPASSVVSTSPVQLAVVEPNNHAPTASMTFTTSSTSSGTGKGGITGGSVTLDASSSSDPDSDPAVNVAGGVERDDAHLTYLFSSSGFKGSPTVQVSCGPTLVIDANTGSCKKVAVSMGIGPQTVTLKVTDEWGASDTKTFNIAVSGVTFSVNSTIQNLTAGQSAIFNGSAASLTGTTLKVVGQPDLATAEIVCTVSPGTIPSGNVVTNFQVLCSTTAPSFAYAPAPRIHGEQPAEGTLSAGVLASSLLPVTGLVLLLPGKTRRARRARMLLVIGLLLALTMMLSSCGGGSNGGGFGGAPKVQNAGTPKGTYTLTVEDSSGTAVGQPLTLVVQ